MRQDNDSYDPFPEWPPLPAGRFASYEWWFNRIQSAHRIKAAIKAGVLKVEPLGPRGGVWLAVYSRKWWRAWAQDFNRRAFRRWEGGRAMQVSRRLGAR